MDKREQREQGRRRSERRINKLTSEEHQGKDRRISDRRKGERRK